MEKIKHLLIVDDDVEIRALLSKLLQKYNFTVTCASNGVEMRTCLAEHSVDLIILDVMLPGEDGFILCRELRAQSQTPIIMLTAIGEDTDRIVGLEMGADDYMAKPFNPRELVARIKAVLRRSEETHVASLTLAPNDTVTEKEEASAYEFDGWRLELVTRQLFSPDNVDIAISNGEFILLKAFLSHAQQVLSRDHLLDSTQNRPAGPFDRSIDVQVSRLRQRIEDDPKNPKFIKTVRGGGYLFTPKVKRLVGHAN